MGANTFLLDGKVPPGSIWVCRCLVGKTAAAGRPAAAGAGALHDETMTLQNWPGEGQSHRHRRIPFLGFATLLMTGLRLPGETIASRAMDIRHAGG